MSDLSLPIQNAPIVELAISVLFEPNDLLNDAHLSPFWWGNRVEFPSVDPMQPIRTDLESFAAGSPFGGSPGQIELLGEPETRLMMTSTDSSWLCQLQKDRLVVNWRKLESEYPRYPAVKARLQQMWSKWSDFALMAGGIAPIPSKWELVYVNKIVPPSKDLRWENILPGLFHKELVNPKGGRLIGRRCQWIWDIDELNTRLVAESRPSLHEPKDSIVMTVTARGETHPAKDVWQSIDDGHELAVNFFESVVSEELLLQCGKDQ